MIKFRPQRGGLAESMALVKEYASLDELIEQFERELSVYCFNKPVNKDTVHIKPYIYDERIGWDTHIVTLEGYGPLGFTDGVFNE